MFGSEVLDVAVGVVFVFLLVSLICTAVREGIEAWMKSRATHLEQGVRELLHDPTATGLARYLYEHPMISVLYHDKYVPTDTIRFWTTSLTRGRNLPSYIPSRNFALALMDMAARGPVIDPASSVARAGAITIASLRDSIAGLGSPPVQRVLLTALDSAEGDLQKVQANIEAWYDAAMERVSGWYKRSTQVVLFFIGLGVAVTLNINTITIADYLYRDNAARAAMVARAEAAVADQNYPRTYPAIQTELQSVKLPIGWESGLPPLRNSDGTPRPNTVDWIRLIGGLLITALAATLGAPFWFDMLNKIMVIRSTVKPHEKSPEEASKDRQPAKAASEAPPERPAAMTTAPAASTAAPPAPSPEAARAADAASQHPDAIDGCDVDFLDFTPDEELPPAEGGVA